MITSSRASAKAETQAKAGTSTPTAPSAGGPIGTGPRARRRPDRSDTPDRRAAHPPVPASPEGVEIEIPVIAIRLSRLVRWCGGGVHVCSVAEHSVLVAKIMERAFIDENGDPETPFIARALLFGLLHDAHEAFTGDMTRQVQDRYAAELPGFTAVRARLNGAWDRVIFAAAGIGEPEAPVTAAVAHADEMAARIERGVLFEGEAGDAIGDGVVHGWPPEQAHYAFMTLYGQLQAVLKG